MRFSVKLKNEKFTFLNETKKILYIGVLVGIFCFIWSLIQSPERAWVNYLVNSNYFISLALGGGVMVAIMAVTQSSWMAPLKRIPESMTSFLPAGLILMLLLFFGVHTLYEWTHESVVAKDHILQDKAIYLNIKFFFIRIIIFFTLWIGLTSILNRLSQKQDKDHDPKHSHKMIKWGAIFLIVFAFSFSLASFDWMMSLKPHWFSTIYGIYNFSGLFVNSLAVITCIVIWLKRKGYFKGVITEDHYHDLGKLLFGFTSFWAYIWLSQYLLIWYSNIPEETVYFLSREHHTWDWLFFFNLAINWVIPFFALMSRGSKRDETILWRVVILLIIGRWLDLYLMIAPEVYEHAGITNPQIGFIEIGMAIGFGSLFTLILTRSLKKKNLVALGDPYLKEGIHLHQ
jgi:hypothetical protein